MADAAKPASASLASESEGWRPIPPTKNASLEEIIREVWWLRTVHETRFDGMDKAIELIQAKADHVPSDMDLAIGRLKELHDAAIMSLKELVAEQNKSRGEATSLNNSTVNKQIDSLKDLFTTTTAGLAEKADDLRVRVQAIEGRSKGMGDLTGWIVGIGGLAVAVAGLGIALFLRG